MEVALEFSKKHGLHDILRVVTLEKNRGKGGGVTHGFRHVRENMSFSPMRMEPRGSAIWESLSRGWKMWLTALTEGCHR